MEGNNLNTGNYVMIQDEIRQKIDKLNVSEKILLVSDIWDSIAQDCSAMPPIQGWQKKELDQRIEEYESGKAELFDWKEVHNELRDEFK